MAHRPGAPTDHCPGAPSDHSLAVPTDRALAVPGDGSPAPDRSLPADRALAVPGDGSPATDRSLPADRALAVPADHSLATDRSLSADRALAVPGDGSLATDRSLPADRALAVTADHSPPTDGTLPADRALAVPGDGSAATDHSLPADRVLVVTADHSLPTDRSLLADQDPAVPADHQPATVRSLPAHQAPVMPADRSLAADRALVGPGAGSPATALSLPADRAPVVPADPSLATDHPLPADRAPAVTSDRSTAADRSQTADRTSARAADRSPAAAQRSPSPSPSCPRSRPAAPDAVSLADTVSLQVDSVSMYGTVESLLQEDGSSLGSDSELNGSTASSQRTDRYGFLGGTQYSSGLESMIPVDISRQREMKWLEMLNRWDKWMARRFDKVKLRCRKGIPSSLRARAWQQLSHSKQLMEQNPGKFEELDRQQGDPRWLDIIEKDLHRQFPFHEMFALRGGHGQQDLYRILKAYTVYRPEEGYCQAQAPVAAVLLMHMPAEQAFWCLVQICEKYLPGYYSAGLEAIQLDGEIFFGLLRRVSPLAYRHLQRFHIDPILYMTEWFMCIYSRTLPWSSVLRVWDMFFCDGVKVIFKVGLVLLRCTLGSVEKLRDCQGMYETMEKLRSIPGQYLHEDFLIHEVTTLKVTEALIEHENRTQRRRWMESRGELQHRPARRLYGARAIGEELSRLNPPLSGSASMLSLTASLVSLRRGREEKRRHRPPHPPPSPTPSASSLSPRPGAVAESLRPSLPSPTSSQATFGETVPDPSQDAKKERQDAKKERQRAEKERQRAEKERQRAEKERQRAEKERARQEAKERQRERRPLKAKGGVKENGAREGPTDANSGSTGLLKDSYF